MNLSLPWLKAPEPPVAAPARGASRPQIAAEPFAAESDALWRPVIWLTLLAIFVGLFSSAASALVDWLDQPVHEVRIQGQTRHLDSQELAQQLAGLVVSPILSLNIDPLHEQALSNPWVHSASVQRRWPAAIEVMVTEEVPVARWGDVGLLNHQGDIFWPELKPEYSDLPRLNGPAHETRAVMQQYHDLSRLLSPAGLRLQGLSLEGRGAWTLELENGIQVVVGREQIMPRLRRFVRLYQAELSQHADKIEQIDIRYTNGAAVRWRAEERQDNAG
ncbi:cell division protein FtsQ/DivIB [Nitrincola tapanii]|uniref:Cell division protein FtsQ n=1 Tax=Nitrincola tapanii TaxID=1708751 RepID=A0A5A9W1F3_9GAMM|nr:cell division protein FtsQ/DivIB [Nitrincola tapanii]KAA0873935.1 FtsQ-type POTRA domain-containing protein [Nitrincola tapanii]